MTIQDYQILAARTCPDLGDEISNILHMDMGIFTEAGEIIDIFKRDHAYKKPIDAVNLGEEIGDMAWYLVNRLRIRGQFIKADFQFSVGETYLSYGKIVSTMRAAVSQYNSEMATIIKLEVIARVFNLDFPTLLQKNIDKLKARYPDKFDADKALNRDLAAERKILEAANPGENYDAIFAEAAKNAETTEAEPKDADANEEGRV